MTSAMLLSAIIFTPTVGALIIALGFNKRDEEPMRIFSLAITVLTFIFTIFLFQQFRAFHFCNLRRIPNRQVITMTRNSGDAKMQAIA